MTASDTGVAAARRATPRRRTMRSLALAYAAQEQGVELPAVESSEMRLVRRAAGARAGRRRKAIGQLQNIRPELVSVALGARAALGCGHSAGDIRDTAYRLDVVLGRPSLARSSWRWLAEGETRRARTVVRTLVILNRSGEHHLPKLAPWLQGTAALSVEHADYVRKQLRDSSAVLQVAQWMFPKEEQSQFTKAHRAVERRRKELETMLRFVNWLPALTTDQSTVPLFELGAVIKTLSDAGHFEETDWPSLPQKIRAVIPDDLLTKLVENLSRADWHFAIQDERQNPGELRAALRLAAILDKGINLGREEPSQKVIRSLRAASGRPVLVRGVGGRILEGTLIGVADWEPDVQGSVAQIYLEEGEAIRKLHMDLVDRISASDNDEVLFDGQQDNQRALFVRRVFSGGTESQYSLGDSLNEAMVLAGADRQARLAAAIEAVRAHRDALTSGERALLRLHQQLAEHISGRGADRASAVLLRSLEAAVVGPLALRLLKVKFGPARRENVGRAFAAIYPDHNRFAAVLNHRATDSSRPIMIRCLLGELKEDLRRALPVDSGDPIFDRARQAVLDASLGDG